MPTKTTGAELKQFYDDEAYWGEGTEWHEELALEVNGTISCTQPLICDLDDTDVITILHGLIRSEKADGPSCTFEVYFNSWRKDCYAAQLTTTQAGSQRTIDQTSCSAGGAVAA